MKIIKTKLHIGVAKPFEILHISDTHLTYADIRDGERKVKLAENRKIGFQHSEEVLETVTKKASEMGTTIICTGDLIDFVSIANLERAKQFTEDNDCFMAAGNHEFSLYVGEAKEDADYRNQSLDKVQAVFKNDIRCSSRVIGGVNFVALDNGYYLFEEEQLAFLKNEVEKGFPIILLMHTPFYEKKLYDEMMTIHPCAYLINVPEELMKNYPKDRYEQQKSDEITRKMVEYIKSQPLIRANICGHIHFNYEGIALENLPQYTTSCTDIRLFEIF